MELPCGPGPRDVLDGQGPWRRLRTPSGRRLEASTKAVGGGHCRLQMPLGLAVVVRARAAWHRLGPWSGGGGGFGTRPWWLALGGGEGHPSNASLPGPEGSAGTQRLSRDQTLFIRGGGGSFGSETHPPQKKSLDPEFG